MVRVTLRLTEDLKAAVEREARRRHTSEADLIRQAIANAVSRRRPHGGFLDAPPFAETSDDVLAGFGVC